MELNDLMEGRLQRRYKRFLADVELDNGELLTAHCPNTGAMTGCAEPGSRVWLSTSTSKTRKYPQTWELVETAQGMACIHSAKANQVVVAGCEAGVVEPLNGYDALRTEVKYSDNSRADILLQGQGGNSDKQVYVEVKSVTLWREGGLGVFPDAVSSRGLKHIRDLQSVVDANTRAVLFFCVMHNGIERVATAGDIDPAYRDGLAEALEAGVEVLTWRGEVSPSGVRLTKQLPFSLDP